MPMTRRSFDARDTLLMLGLMFAVVASAPPAGAQGLVQGVQQGASAGNKAAGPVGGVLGGAIGGVVGVFTGVLGVPAQQNAAPHAATPAQKNSPVATPPAAVRQAAPTKGIKQTKQAKAAPSAAEPAAAAQPPELTAEQIVANSDANIERIKNELKLTPEQERQWLGFNSAMHYLGHNGAERLKLRNERAKRDPPDDIIEQMRNEAQFLSDRSADQRSVADAAEPLFASLDDKQKAIFIEEMVRLSQERGLD